MIHEPLTKLQCCPTSDGGAAVVVVSQAFLDARPHLKEQAVLIAGQQMATDSPELFSRSDIDLVGYEMSKFAGAQALKEAGITPNDVSVVELHDCFSANEMCVIDALGLSEKGKAHELVRNGDITYSGDKYIINPSGGLISKGHPLGMLSVPWMRPRYGCLHSGTMSDAVVGHQMTSANGRRLNEPGPVCH